MALKITLSGDGPGYGTFTITGAERWSEAVEIAIQRNLDDRYLEENGDWHTTLHWHPTHRLESKEGQLRLRVGPEIVDSVVAAANMALRVWMRTGGIEDQGILRIKGQLLGSHAAAEAMSGLDIEGDSEARQREADQRRQQAEAHQRLAEQAQQEEAQARREQEARHIEQQQRRQREADAKRRLLEAQAKAHKERRKRLLRILAGVLLVLLMLAAVWKFGWLDGLTVPEEKTKQEEPSTPVGQTRPESQPEASLLGGRQFVQTYLNRDPKPTPQEMFTEAQAREQIQDCNAAMLLYSRAAIGNAELARTLAQRYDPDTFRAGGCIEAPSADTASHWYANPAMAGDSTAQRQLGKILSTQYTSGPVYERGIQWLQQAAQAGDEQARALLAERTKP